MNREQTIRAWKNPAFRAQLNQAQLAAVPASPAGAIELSTDELMDTVGGTDPVTTAIATAISITIPIITVWISKSLGDES